MNWKFPSKLKSRVCASVYQLREKQLFMVMPYHRLGNVNNVYDNVTPNRPQSADLWKGKIRLFMVLFLLGNSYFSHIMNVKLTVWQKVTCTTISLMDFWLQLPRVCKLPIISVYLIYRNLEKINRFYLTQS